VAVIDLVRFLGYGRGHLLSMRCSCRRCSATQSGYSSAPPTSRSLVLPPKLPPYAVPVYPVLFLSRSYAHLCLLISRFRLSIGLLYLPHLRSRARAIAMAIDMDMDMDGHGFIGDRNDDDCSACMRRTTVPFGRCSFLSSANYPIHYLYCYLRFCLPARTAFTAIS
jgi:hypothetical protein